MRPRLRRFALRFEFIQADMAAELALASSEMTTPFPCAIFLAYNICAGLTGLEFVQRAYPALQYHFAKGSEIDPEKVEPALEFNRRAYPAIRISFGWRAYLGQCRCLRVSAGACGISSPRGAYFRQGSRLPSTMDHSIANLRRAPQDRSGYLPSVRVAGDPQRIEPIANSKQKSSPS